MTAGGNFDRTLIQRKPWERKFRSGKSALAKEDYAEAEKILTSAYEDVLQYDSGDPRLANISNSLAELYSKKKQYDEAEKFYKVTIEIWEKTFGSHYSGLVNVFDGYAKLLNELGRKEEENEFRKRCKEIVGS